MQWFIAQKHSVKEKGSIQMCALLLCLHVCSYMIHSFYQRPNLNTTHYWRKMELVTLHLFLSWSKCPLVYYHISLAVTDSFVQTLGRVFEGIQNLLFKWTAHKNLNFIFTTNSFKHPRSSKTTLMTQIRTIGLITSVSDSLCFCESFAG